MSARLLVSLAVVGVAGAILFACGNDSSSGTPPPNGTDGGLVDEAGNPIPPGGEGGTVSGDGGCGPSTCKSGCCAMGVCVEGKQPSQCGKGGLACVDCTPLSMGCANQGCAVVTKCENCDGCCQAGTCNPNGKTQDDSCGANGALCVDCTGSSRTCNGNGSCI
jgi:hypothetical protein